MPLVKILKHWPATENYEVGQVYDISNIDSLLAEGNVEIATAPKADVVKPVEVEVKKPEPFKEELKEELVKLEKEVLPTETKVSSVSEGADVE